MVFITSINLTRSGCMFEFINSYFPRLLIMVFDLICNSYGTLPLLKCAILGFRACTPSKCMIYNNV